VQLLEELLVKKNAHLHIDAIVVCEAPSEYASGDDMRQPYFLHDVYQVLQFFPTLDFPALPMIPKEARDKDESGKLFLLTSSILLDLAERLRGHGDALPLISSARKALAAFWHGDETALRSQAPAGVLLNADRPDVVSAQLKTNMTRLISLGHYQGAMICTMGEWFWGADRFQLFVDRLIAGGYVSAGTVLPVSRSIPALPAKLSPAASAALSCIHIDVYFSFRSPYSYLALPQMEQLRDKYPGVHLHLKPVMPMVKRGLPVPLSKRLYIVEDCKRESVMKQIPFGKMVDPLDAVERLLALFSFAREKGDGREWKYAHSVARGTWSEGFDAKNVQHVRTLWERAIPANDIAWAECVEYLKRMETAPDNGYKTMVETHRTEMSAMSIWGVPSFCMYKLTTSSSSDTSVKTELFRCWGQDRIRFMDAILADIALPSSSAKL
jgi:2-hydroxychromene-2-carboxylate isomerase